jgi:hypothetical protein
LLVALSCIAGSTNAQELAPGVTYSSTIPTLKQVLGYEPGAEITTPEGIAIYLKALHDAAPDRTRLVEYARTWEGRPLYLFIVASPERLAAADQLTADLTRLADPRGLSAGDADRLIASLPVVVWLMHAVHGNEISSCDAALYEAYHLLAAEHDSATDAVRKNAVVLIDPLQNPDGRARFISQTLLGRAAEPDGDPASAEHDEPWPGGRSNHYLFDMNRDWFAQSQPETIGRIKIGITWHPQVVVDLHEMGGESTYYFAPPADPLNPYITKTQAGWLEAFGRANAARFDARGFPYFIRELYDSFYPGYGESWPIYNGAVGMTYEKSSARGLVYRRRDGTVLTYRDGIVQHFTAALTTMETAAAHREQLLRDFLEYRRSAVADGERTAPHDYVLVPGRDASKARRLADLLVLQGIEVRQTSEPLAISANKTIPAGAFLISAAQPSGRLVRNLLEPHVPQPESFVKEQDRRRRNRMGDQFYDVTGWSLPLLSGVEVATLDRAASVRATALTMAPPAPRRLPAAKVGYLIPWGFDAATLVAQALTSGVRVRHVTDSFTLGGRKYTAGTAVVRVSDNDQTRLEKFGALAASAPNVEIVPVDTGWVDQGPSLGSSDVVGLKAPRVLLLWDTPTYSQSAGWARFVLERRFRQPVTVVRVSSLGRIELSSFDVIVMPSGNYGSAFGEDYVRRLKDWMRAGGTLVTIADATRWATGEKVGLLETHTELRDGKPDVDATEKEKKTQEAQRPFDLEKAIAPEHEQPENTPGAVLRVTLDSEHWLSAGNEGETAVMVDGQRVFAPIKLDKGRNVGLYAAKDRLVAGGLVWDDAREALAQKAFLIEQPVGRGHLVAFAEDPNFRAFTEATELMFANAVLLGPAY